MGNPVPALVFGGFLIVLGTLMLKAQRRAKAKLKQKELSEHDFRFLNNRVRRRIQVAGMILLIGIMIPVGDSLIPWQQAVLTFAIYWIIVLILAGWTIVLAFADIAATRLHSSVEMARLQHQQKNLERAVEELRAAKHAAAEDTDQ